jgi:hypothetical protein
MFNLTQIEDSFSITLENKRIRNFSGTTGHYSTFWDICRDGEKIGQLSRSNQRGAKYRVMQAIAINQILPDPYIYERFDSQYDALQFAAQYL